MKEKKNIWTHFLDFTRDFGIVVLEAIFLFLSALSPWLYKLNAFVPGTGTDPSEVIWIVLTNTGKWPLSVAIFIFWLLAIRKFNRDSILNSTGTYHDYARFFYWLAAFLGFKKCNLVGVPIPLQIYLVMRQVFEEYPLQEDYTKDENSPTISEHYDTTENENLDSEKAVNLILEDTYKVKDDLSQLPESIRVYRTIKISCCGVEGVHKYSPSFIDKVAEEVSKLPAGTELNVFATTNPKNQEQITRKVFAKAGRGNIALLRLYQQHRSGDRLFDLSLTIKGECAEKP